MLSSERISECNSKVSHEGVRALKSSNSLSRLNPESGGIAVQVEKKDALTTFGTRYFFL